MITQLMTNDGYIYRLPTEAEREYSVRAGTVTRYYFGDDANKLKLFAWIGQNPISTEGERTSHQVGTVPFSRDSGAKPWGFVDMYGNVGEWVSDCYTIDYNRYGTGGPPVQEQGDCRWVSRGGDILFTREPDSVYGFKHPPDESETAGFLFENFGASKRTVFGIFNLHAEFFVPHYMPFRNYGLRLSRHRR